MRLSLTKNPQNYDNSFANHLSQTLETTCEKADLGSGLYGSSYFKHA